MIHPAQDLEDLATQPADLHFERLVTRWVMACACVVPALAVLSGSF